MSKNYSVKTTKGDFMLKREEFSDLGISICIPEFLEDLSEDELQQKFIFDQKPTALKANLGHKIMFTINAAPIDIHDANPDDSVSELMLMQQKIISRLTPGYQEYGIKMKKFDEHILACLNYKSHSLEDDMYNIFYLFIHKGKMIHGLFSCLLADQVEWNLVFLMCLDTLKFIGE